MRYLLDKNIVRYAIAGLRFGHLRTLSLLEIGALSLWRFAEARGIPLFISDSSYHILQRLEPYDEVQLFLAATEVLTPSRYHVRWSRRIRQTTGLAPEDAAMIALATFGTDHNGHILGTELLVTYDRRMITGYQTHITTLSRRLRAMTAQLPLPFSHALLPHLSTPDTLLTTSF